MNDDIVADFTADVEVSDWDSDTPRQSRVVLSESWLGVATNGTKRSIDFEDVFDVVRDVSTGGNADDSETVAVAFRDGEAREVISLSETKTTLLRFQRVLYTQLLDGTEAAVEHYSDGERTAKRGNMRLRVTDTHVRLVPGTGQQSGIEIPRDDITEFETASETFDGEQEQPVVSLYTASERRVTRTVLRLPSFRLLNLFGRYLLSELSLPTEVEGDEQPGQATRGQRIRLLLVDDEPHDLEMAELFLKQQSDAFNITTASDGREALTYLSDQSFDCIVSDFKMPGIDGLDLLKQVRDDYPTLPFILYTGEGSEAVAKKAILDDVTDYVEKDVGIEQYEILAERIQRAVR